MWNDPDAQHRPHLSSSHLNSLKLPRSMSSKGKAGKREMRTCSMKEWQEQKISERHGEMEEYGWRWSRGGPRWQWLIIHFITSCSAPLLLLWGFFLLFHCSSWGGMLCAFVCLYFDDSLPSFSLFPASHYLFPSFPAFSPTPSLSLSLASLPLSLSLWLWVISSSTTNQACPKFTHAL